MPKTLTYLFDPLCGWCYGASAAVAAAAATPGVVLRLLPTGLFADAGARAMSDDFAAYAWANDQRIGQVTGQPFSAAYRVQVLASRTQRFDSGPATRALTAVALTAPAQELAALQAIQHARFVLGQDVTQPATLTAVLRRLGLADAVTQLAQTGADLQVATHARTQAGQALMRTVGARGVPTFVLDADTTPRILHSATAHEHPQAWAAQLAAT
ncbi:MAG: DsbA family protein [Pseudomonadota bacterium]|nr:DsbA family protein [Pseudomonadota bacterium]